MGLLIVCFCEERKQFGTEDMGPTSTPSLLFYISFYRTKVNTKQIAMQRKTSNTEDIEEYQEEQVMSYKYK